MSEPQPHQCGLPPHSDLEIRGRPPPMVEGPDIIKQMGEDDRQNSHNASPSSRKNSSCFVADGAMQISAEHGKRKQDDALIAESSASNSTSSFQEKTMEYKTQETNEIVHLRKPVTQTSTSPREITQSEEEVKSTSHDVDDQATMPAPKDRPLEASGLQQESQSASDPTTVISKENPLNVTEGHLSNIDIELGAALNRSKSIKGFKLRYKNSNKIFKGNLPKVKIIQGSNGTGKTSLLVHLVLLYLTQLISPPRKVLVITSDNNSTERTASLFEEQKHLKICKVKLAELHLIDQADIIISSRSALDAHCLESQAFDIVFADDAELYESHQILHDQAQAGKDLIIFGNQTKPCNTSALNLFLSLGHVPLYLPVQYKLSQDICSLLNFLYEQDVRTDRDTHTRTDSMNLYRSTQCCILPDKVELTIRAVKLCLKLLIADGLPPENIAVLTLYEKLAEELRIPLYDYINSGVEVEQAYQNRNRNKTAVILIVKGSEFPENDIHFRAGIARATCKLIVIAPNQTERRQSDYVINLINLLEALEDLLTLEDFEQAAASSSPNIREISNESTQCSDQSFDEEGDPIDETPNRNHQPFPLWRTLS